MDVSAITVAGLIAFFDQNEIWRRIEGFPRYEVSSFGNVRGPKGLLKPFSKSGYLVVTLCRGDAQRDCRVHRLVAQAFLGPAPFDGAVAAHNDGSRDNARLSNVRWATQSENRADRVRHETLYQGSQVVTAKLSEEHIPTIRDRIAQGDRTASIAADYSVSMGTISHIKRGKTWKHVPSPAAL